ncbi:MAG: ribosome biogenesis GTP-binding protein YihA/YsxC [Dialister pneumosintes]|mgnify:FL=1
MAEIKEISKFHIFSATYQGSTVRWDTFSVQDKLEIAFIGRSNVGKSSLINSLCGNRKLARVSREPGKTRTINFYDIQSRRQVDGVEERQRWHLVDLPGYGFAKTNNKNTADWSTFIAEYIKKSPQLALLCLLVDARHPGLAIDREAYAWLCGLHIPLQIIATKGDKLNAGEKNKNKREIANLFPTNHSPILYSSLKGYGKAELLSLLENIICR